MPESFPARLTRWWPLFLFVALLLLLVGVFYSGYRLGPGLSVVRLHKLTVTDLPHGAQIYVDGDPKGTAKTATLDVKLAPGNHTVLASADGHYPFGAVTEMPDHDAKLSAFLIPAATPLELIKKGEEGPARTALAAYRLPSREKPLLLSGGCAAIFVAENRVIAEATSTASCTPPAFLCIEGSCAATEIFTPVASLRSVLRYPGREDALLVAAGADVYALGLDPRTPRPFAPVLQGTEPVIAESGESILGRDGTIYFSLMF